VLCVSFSGPAEAKHEKNNGIFVFAQCFADSLTNAFEHSYIVYQSRYKFSRTTAVPTQTSTTSVAHIKYRLSRTVVMHVLDLNTQHMRMASV